MKPDYEKNGVQLFNCDCRDVLPTLGKVDAVVTDPPYGVNFRYENNDDKRDGYEEWCCQWFDACRVCSAVILMSSGHVNVPMWAKLRPFDWQIAWLKPAAMGRSTVGFSNWEPMLLWGKGNGKSVDVITAPIIPDIDIDGHPCPKPILWGIKSVACVSLISETILDPFMGSGTTGVACVRLGRKFIGIEIEPKYFDIAVRRIEAAFDETSLLDYAQTQEQLDLAGGIAGERGGR